MRRIAIINQKGGVGKTTTSANLGAALAEQGRRVVVVDMDPQANASLHLGIEVGPTDPSVYSVLVGEKDFASCLRATGAARLSVLPSNIDLSGAELELASAIGRDSLIRDAIETWCEAHRKEHGEDPADYVIFDCPPSLGLLSINALAAAGEVMITLQTQFLALMGMSKLVEVVQLIRKRLNPELTITGIVPCLYDSRLKLNREVLGEVRKYFPGQVFKTAIRSNVKVAEAPSFGVSILDYASESNGAQDYRQLALEVIEQESRDAGLATLPPAREINELARERAAEQLAAKEREFEERDARRDAAPKSSAAQPASADDEQSAVTKDATESAAAPTTAVEATNAPTAPEPRPSRSAPPNRRRPRRRRTPRTNDPRSPRATRRRRPTPPRRRRTSSRHRARRTNSPPRRRRTSRTRERPTATTTNRTTCCTRRRRPRRARKPPKRPPHRRLAASARSRTNCASCARTTCRNSRRKPSRSRTERGGAHAMRVGILCHPTYGGSGVVASECALSLARRGHRVHVFSPGVPPRLAHDTGGVVLHEVRGLDSPLFRSSPDELATTGAVLGVLESEGLDVLHAHYALPHAVTAHLAREAARATREDEVPRLVVTLHGTDVTLVADEPSYASLLRHVLRSVDAVTAVSDDLARRTRDWWGDGAREIETLPNFVDTEVFRPTEREAGPLACVHVSNFRPLKRVPWLVEAFASGTRGTDASLLLVGDGPDRSRCEDLVRELGLEHRVRFCGEHDALPDLLAPRDAFLSSSREESFGLSALEASACGLGVLGTRVGGVPEVVHDGETGVLVDADDQQGFARELRAWAAEPERARSFGRAGRTLAVTRYDREAGVRRYEDLYRRLTER